MTRLVREERRAPAPKFGRLRSFTAANRYRLFTRQSVFSGISALLSFTMGITFLIDYTFGEVPFEAYAFAIWAGSYLLFTVLPLAFGRRYPWWLGLSFAAYITALTSLLLAYSNRASFVMIALLELPLLAVYLGWFFVPWLARFSLAIGGAALLVGILLGPAVNTSGFSQELAFVYAILISVLCLETGRHLRRSAERQAQRDPLTGMLNRRGFHALARRAVDRARRAGFECSPVVFVAIDLDNLAMLNNTAGHAAGDRALIESAELWRRTVGAEDLVARTGGDEFIMLLHGTEQTARKLLLRCAERTLHQWSWGLAEMRDGETIDQVISRADAELYRSKPLKRS